MRAHIHAGMYGGHRLTSGVFISFHIIYLLIYLVIEQLSVGMRGDHMCLSLWAILLSVSTLSSETDSLPDPRAYWISLQVTRIVPSTPQAVQNYLCV